jgi:hypothetical protein
MVLTVLLSGCGGQIDQPATDQQGEDLFGSSSSVCPTAPEYSTNTWWRWRTVRDIDAVVWSSDGTQVLAAEAEYEEKEKLFSGGMSDSRKLCHRLSLWTPDGKKIRQLGEYPNQHADVTFMGTYAVVESFNGATEEFHRVALDGSRTLITSVSADCTSGYLIPSPDGGTIAMVSVVTNCNGPLMGSSATVSFFDGKGKPTGSSASQSFTGWSQGTWTPSGRFLVGDDKQAFDVTVAGVKTMAILPKCWIPPTTSSDVAADGRIVGVVNNKPAITGTDTTRAFGCQ